MGAVDLQVVVSGGVVGRVRIALRERELVVHEAELLGPGHAAVLGDLLECRALADEAHRVVLDGDAGALGLLADAGWAAVVSQRLRLDVRPVPADAGTGDAGLRLAPMGRETFELFLERTTQGCVAARAGSGEPPDQARRVALDQLATLLPDGPDSADQHLFTAWVAGTPVGHLWLGTERPGAFVHDIEIAEEERHRGHGRALMRAAEDWARERGLDHVGLDVLADNTVARALYADLGYTPTHTTYARPVGA